MLQHPSDGSTGVRLVLARNMASQVMLSANILRARPPVTDDQVSWSNGHGPLVDPGSSKYVTTVTAAGTQANLTIATLSLADTGLYTVTVVHETGTFSLQFRLEVFSKLCV